MNPDPTWDMHVEGFEEFSETTLGQRELRGSESYSLAVEMDHEFRRYLEEHGIADDLINDPRTAYVALTVGKFFAYMVQLGTYDVEEHYETAMENAEGDEDAEAGAEFAAQIAASVNNRLMLSGYVAMQRLNWAAYNIAVEGEKLPEPYGETVSSDSLAHLDFEMEEESEEE